MKLTSHIALALATGLLGTGSAIAESHDAGGSMASGSGAEFEITGDPAAGEKVFRKCMACHAVGEGARNKVGPVLNGVVGRDVASVEDFQYSNVLQEMGSEGKVWTPEEMAAFLEGPRDYAPGTKMAFPGLKDQADRENVIAYLASFEAE